MLKRSGRQQLYGRIVFAPLAYASAGGEPFGIARVTGEAELAGKPAADGAADGLPLPVVPDGVPAVQLAIKSAAATAKATRALFMPFMVIHEFAERKS